jgi:hypothetical protein
LNEVTTAHVSTTTATMTAAMTHVSATRNSTTKAPKFQLTQVQHKTMNPSILHPAGNMMAHIDATPKSLLLLHVKDGPVIMPTNHEPILLFYA